MQARFSIFNGQFIDRNNPTFLSDSIRALGQFSLRYEFRACETGIFFFHEQIALIQREADFFRMPLPRYIAGSNFVFLRELKRLLNKNKLFGGARISLTLWSEGKNSHYFIQACEIESNIYQLPEKGALLSILDIPVKSVHPGSILPTFSSQLWKVGEIFCKENGFDQCLIQNQHNNLIEVPHGNLFVLKKEKLYTPDLLAGPVQTILRDKVMKIGEEIGLNVIASKSITPDLLRDADEVFWTDNICGLKWAMGWKDRRYFCRFARVVVNELNIEARKQKPG